MGFIEEHSQALLTSLSQLLSSAKLHIQTTNTLVQSGQHRLQSQQEHLLERFDALFRSDSNLFHTWPFSYLTRALRLLPPVSPFAAEAPEAPGASSPPLSPPSSSSSAAPLSFEALLDALQQLPLDVAVGPLAAASAVSLAPASHAAVVSSVVRVIEALGGLDAAALKASSLRNLPADTQAEPALIVVLFAVAKCCILLRNSIFQQALAFSLPLEQHLQYWEYKLNHPLYHCAQVLPQTLYSTFHSFNHAWSRAHLIQQLVFAPVQAIQAHHEAIRDLKCQHASLLGYLSHWRRSLDPSEWKASSVASYKGKTNPNLPLNLSHSESVLVLGEFCTEFVLFLREAFQSHNHDGGGSSLASDASRSVYMHERDTISTVGDLIDKLATIPQLALKHQARVQLTVKEHGLPGRWTRYWIPSTAAVVGSWLALRELTFYRGDLLDWLADTKETLVRFAREWLFRPLLRIYETVRYDENQMALINAKSLQNDLDSLERMVRDFAVDHLNLPEKSLDAIMANARDGDLSVVMREYEMNIREPYKSLLFGNLARTALIQVQKSKVDLEMAMTSIDKLMKSNELNFQVLAAVPTFLFVRFLYHQTVALWKHRSGLPVNQYHQQIRLQLRRLEIILNRHNSPDARAISFEDEGLIIICLHMLRVCGRELDDNDFTDDLREIENFNEFQTQQRMAVISRMYRTHAFLGIGI